MFDHSTLYNFIAEEKKNQNVVLNIAKLKNQALNLKTFDRFCEVLGFEKGSEKFNKFFTLNYSLLRYSRIRKEFEDKYPEFVPADVAAKPKHKDNRHEVEGLRKIQDFIIEKKTKMYPDMSINKLGKLLGVNQISNIKKFGIDPAALCKIVEVFKIQVGSEEFDYINNLIGSPDNIKGVLRVNRYHDALESLGYIPKPVNNTISTMYLAKDDADPKIIPESVANSISTIKEFKENEKVGQDAVSPIMQNPMTPPIPFMPFVPINYSKLFGNFIPSPVTQPSPLTVSNVSENKESSTKDDGDAKENDANPLSSAALNSDMEIGTINVNGVPTTVARKIGTNKESVVESGASRLYRSSNKELEVKKARIEFGNLIAKIAFTKDIPRTKLCELFDVSSHEMDNIILGKTDTPDYFHIKRICERLHLQNLETIKLIGYAGKGRTSTEVVIPKIVKEYLNKNPLALEALYRAAQENLDSDVWEDFINSFDRR